MNNDYDDYVGKIVDNAIQTMDDLFDQKRPLKAITQEIVGNELIITDKFMEDLEIEFNKCKSRLTALPIVCHKYGYSMNETTKHYVRFN